MTRPKSLSPEPPLGALWAAAWRNVPPATARILADGGCALEVGCGSGLGCLALAEAVPGARVVGHDARPRSIARAKQLARAAGLDQRVTFRIDDSTRLPRASFHLITAERLRDSCPDPARVLNAIRNALVRDGLCLLLEPPRARWGSPSDALDLPTLVRQAGFSRLRPLPSESPSTLYELQR